MVKTAKNQQRFRALFHFCLFRAVLISGIIKSANETKTITSRDTSKISILVRLAKQDLRLLWVAWRMWAIRRGARSSNGETVKNGRHRCHIIKLYLIWEQTSPAYLGACKKGYANIIWKMLLQYQLSTRLTECMRPIACTKNIENKIAKRSLLPA